jgi:hypothetical protein
VFPPETLLEASLSIVAKILIELIADAALGKKQNLAGLRRTELYIALDARRVCHPLKDFRKKLW